MSYELAKELKDAGLPQLLEKYSVGKIGYTQIETMRIIWKDGLTQQVVFDGKYWTARDGDKWTQEELELSNCAKIPTLSELIEVCEDESYLLQLLQAKWEDGIGWIATIEKERKEITRNNSGISKDLKEAVAKLYLKLREIKQ